MTLQTYFGFRAQGLALVAQAQGTSKSQMVSWGATPDEADQLLGLYAVYFGQTPYTRIQEKARATTHGLDDLLRIEKFVGRVKKVLDRWKLRRTLCETPAHLIDSVAKEELAKLAKPKKDPEFGLTIRRYENYRRIVITGAPLAMETFWESQDGSFERFQETLKGGLGEPAVAVNMIVTMDQHDQILDGDGEEITLRTTNGAVMTGAEYLNMRLAERGYALLHHPVEGKVNLYRTQRFANPKQRHAASIMNPTCSTPGCRKPATESQVHHVTAYKDGGNTNMNDTAMACPYHNGVNGDDPTYTPRGRIEIAAGVGGWRPPWGGPLQFNESAFRFPAPADAAGPAGT